MARDEITLNYMTYDAKDTVGSVCPTPKAVTQANGIVLKKAFACKDNSLKIIVQNTAEADKTLTIKAGQKQNACLGDQTVALTASKTTIVAPIRDMARFERADGSIYLDFSSGFTGYIYAVAEKAGL